MIFLKKIAVVKKGESTNWPQEITAYTDGASRSNPGEASIGLVIFDKENNCLYEEGSYLGKTTNNVAEYTGILRVLDLAVKNKVAKLTIKTDSELATKQMKGLYKIKSALLKPIYSQCKELESQIEDFNILHIQREDNHLADALANATLDQI